MGYEISSMRTPDAKMGILWMIPRPVEREAYYWSDGSA